jgi:hypothetical protein
MTTASKASHAPPRPSRHPDCEKQAWIGDLVAEHRVEQKPHPGSEGDAEQSAAVAGHPRAGWF